MKEGWLTVKGFDNYSVSDGGRVRRDACTITYKNGHVCRYSEKMLKFDKMNKNKRGKFYFRVTLSSENRQKRFQVHRLVAMHFIENNLNKRCVNHKDGNPENNNASNLEWCTHSENERHSYDVLGKINSNRLLKNKDDIEYIRKHTVKGINGNTMDMAIKFNVSRDVIMDIVNNVTYV